MNIAIIGATGVVGQMMIKVLHERKVKFEKLYLFASKKSVGKRIEVWGKEYEIIELTKENIDKVNIDVALFSAGKTVSLEFIPYMATKGISCIDNSSAFRMDEKVPLVVPEVNFDVVKKEDKIIANPNCSTIQAVVAINPIYKKYGIKRIIYSTYQAVSGAGKKGIDDLINTLNGKEAQKFPYQIANNCLPHIDDFENNGYTKEEMKMINETRKILKDNKLKITATTVRVPVLNSHSESINVELNNEFELSEIFELLEKEKDIVLYDNIEKLKYPIATLSNDKDEVFVGRIRRDFSVDNGINMWVVADNIRKGAATNAVQILEALIQNEFIK